MEKKVFIPANNNNKALAFFAEIDKKKEEAKRKFIAQTARLKEKLTKNTIKN
jgi:hypothetical protein